MGSCQLVFLIVIVDSNIEVAIQDRHDRANDVEKAIGSIHKGGHTEN
jgi:hypothetical protein